MTAMRKTLVAALVGAAAALSYPMAATHPVSPSIAGNGFAVKEPQRQYDDKLSWPRSVSFQTSEPVGYDESPDTEHRARWISQTVTTITLNALNLVGTANAAPR